MSDTTHIGVFIDESYSMLRNHAGVIQGANEFVGNVRRDVGDNDVRLTLGTWDLGQHPDILRIKHEDVPLKEAPELRDEDYAPRGSTPLNDATIKAVQVMSKLETEGDKVMVVIFTDGQENCSEADTATVRKLIAEKEQAGWEFVYLGANQDAWSEGTARGVRGDRSYNFVASSKGTSATMRSMSRLASSYATSSAHEHKATADALHASVGGNLGEDGLEED